MLSGTEEIKLINQAINGDQNAYKVLYDHHIDGLFAFLNQFSKDRDLVRDWTQRAFIKAFNKLNTFQFKARFKSWLFTIGLNEMRTDMRSSVMFVELQEPEIEDLPDEDIDPELWDHAKQAIRDLDPQKKMILLLHVAEGYSHKEIAGMLSIKEGTSRIILHRTKEELRKKVNS